MLFKRKPKGTITVQTRESQLYTSLLQEPHVLIGGATGSGKSVVENGIINSLCVRGNGDMILIDPKKTELYPWSRSRHCIGYADDIPSIRLQMKRAEKIMDDRFCDMRSRGLRTYDGRDIYIFIDEYIDIAPQVERDRTVRKVKNDIDQSLIRILSLGRAAKVHCFLCTQTPRARVITDIIRANIVSRVALHTKDATESRILMDAKGCELLPRYGQGYVVKPDGRELWNLPMIEEEYLNNAIRL